MIFSAIYGVMLNPFPYKDSQRLVTFAISDPTSSGDSSRDYLTLPEFLDYREQNRVFEDMIGTSTFGVVLSGAGDITLVDASLLSANSFEFLGVPAALGRWATTEDAKPDAPPVFLMSYQLWREQFNGDPKILGKSFTFTQNSESRRWLNGVPRTLIGIMPPRFRLGHADLWIPFTMDHNQASSDARVAVLGIMAVGRLKRGVSLQNGSANLNLIAHNLAKTYSNDYPKQFRVVATPFTEGEIGRFRVVIYPVLAAVVMLLLIACSNVTNLLLARATVREREIAIRASMGASRGRLIRQLLVESFILAVGACLAGCLFAYLGIREIVPFIPPGILPQEAVVELNPYVLLFSMIVTVLSTLLCGLAPIVHAVGGQLQPRLTRVWKSTRVSILRGNLRATLVVVEVALSIVLLTCAGLMMRTFLAMTHVDLGFNPRKLLETAMYLPRASYGKPEQKKLFFRQVLERVTSLPGVIAATETMMVPPFRAQGPTGFELTVPGAPHSGRFYSILDMVSEGYFQTLGLHLLRGRLMTAEDVELTRLVAVVNETLARRFFGDGDPIGQRIKINSFDKSPAFPHDAYFEIIGVVTDLKNRGLKDPPDPEVFLPYTIGPGGGGIMVRTAADSNSVPQAVLRQIWAVDRSVTPARIETIESLLQRDYYEYPEFELVTLGAFAGIGLLLVVTGVFSVMAYTVSLQTHEIGIRMALGAQQGDILRMVLNNGLGLLAAGVAFGILASLALTRVLASQIWSVSATDPWTFGAAVAVMFTFGLAACFLPARRATKVDPMVALRYE
jgi:putative ABC transport system permease protein